MRSDGNELEVISTSPSEQKKPEGQKTNLNVQHLEQRSGGGNLSTSVGISLPTLIAAPTGLDEDTN